MQVKKGTVSYQGRNDWECLYGEVELDGKQVQYYFMDNGNLPNGNFIASTHLVEAIDREVQTQNIGMIDSEGNIILPFEHKSIKVIPGDILLVEKNKPTTQSVLEAIDLKKDPLAATRLVSTPAAIKEKLNAQMGVEGRYLFNDQFSEASIFDFDGNNLINDEYFSFVGISNGKLYFTKNIVEAPITEYSIFPAEVREENTEMENAIDMETVASDNQDLIEQAIEAEVENKEQELSKELSTTEDTVNEEESVDADAKTEEENNVETESVVAEESIENTEDAVTEEVTQESDIVSEVQEESTEEVNNEEIQNVEDNNEETVNVETSEDDETDVVDTKEESVENSVIPLIKTENSEEEAVEEKEETEEVSNEETQNMEDNNEKVDSAEIKEEVENTIDHTEEEQEEVANEMMEEKEFEDSEMFGESILKTDSIEEYDNFNLDPSNDNIMDKVMGSLADLIADNRKKQEVIENQDEKNRMLLDEIKSLKNELEDKDKRLIDAEKELAILRAQTKTNDKLLKLLDDANTLLGKDNYTATDNEGNYFNSKVA